MAGHFRLQRFPFRPAQLNLLQNFLRLPASPGGPLAIIVAGVVPGRIVVIINDVVSGRLAAGRPGERVAISGPGAIASANAVTRGKKCRSGKT